MDEFEEITEEQASGPILTSDTQAFEADAGLPVSAPEVTMNAAPAASNAPPTVVPEPPMVQPAVEQKKARRTLTELVEARRREHEALKARYEAEFANIKGRKPKARFTNAGRLENKDPAAKEDLIKGFLIRDRAAYNVKRGRKTVRKNSPTVQPRSPPTRRNAPSILSETRSEAKRIRDDAKRALSELQTRAAAELRLIGANASVLHQIFHFTRSDKGHSRGPRTR